MFLSFCCGGMRRNVYDLPCYLLHSEWYFFIVFKCQISVLQLSILSLLHHSVLDCLFILFFIGLCISFNF
jgi:hypothetical protein